MSASAPSQPDGGRPRPAVLCVLDGWGERPDPTDNAIAAAKHPNYDRMLGDSPHARLATSGRAVGLPEGQMGNSEVGHTNIGAGRLVLQDLPRIDDAVKDGSLATRPALRSLIEAAKKTTGTVHLMGLMSPGGVHSHQDHMTALSRIFAQAGLSVPRPMMPLSMRKGPDSPPRKPPSTFPMRRAPATNS